MTVEQRPERLQKGRVMPSWGRLHEVWSTHPAIRLSVEVVIVVAAIATIVSLVVKVAQI